MYNICIHILAIVNNAPINTGVHVSFQISVFVFFRYVPESGIAASYGGFSFSFLRSLCTVSHNGCTKYTSTSSVQGFRFLQVLASTCYLCSF